MIRKMILAAALLAAAPAFAQTAPAAKPMTTPAPVQSTAMTPDAARLDINSATVEQLAGVKGLGKTLAEAIVKGRPYKSADDLVTSKILTGEVFALVKDFLIVRQK
jgi:DNA uptake protein ComE-like DNA-binding protein